MFIHLPQYIRTHKQSNAHCLSCFHCSALIVDDDSPFFFQMKQQLRGCVAVPQIPLTHMWSWVIFSCVQLHSTIHATCDCVLCICVGDVRWKKQSTWGFVFYEYPWNPCANCKRVKRTVEHAHTLTLLHWQYLTIISTAVFMCMCGASLCIVNQELSIGHRTERYGIRSCSSICASIRYQTSRPPTSNSRLYHSTTIFDGVNLAGVRVWVIFLDQSSNDRMMSAK